MEDVTTTKFYFLLCLFREGEADLYARDCSFPRASRRSWILTDKRTKAFRFQNRSDARQQTRSVDIKLKLARAGWLWEVIKVTETIVTSFEEEIVASNAPDMVVLARAAS